MSSPFVLPLLILGGSGAIIFMLYQQKAAADAQTLLDAQKMSTLTAQNQQLATNQQQLADALAKISSQVAANDAQDIEIAKRLNENINELNNEMVQGFTRSWAAIADIGKNGDIRAKEAQAVTGTIQPLPTPDVAASAPQAGVGGVPPPETQSLSATLIKQPAMAGIVSNPIVASMPPQTTAAIATAANAVGAQIPFMQNFALKLFGAK